MKGAITTSIIGALLLGITVLSILLNESSTMFDEQEETIANLEEEISELVSDKTIAIESNKRLEAELITYKNREAILNNEIEYYEEEMEALVEENNDLKDDLEKLGSKVKEKEFVVTAYSNHYKSTGKTPSHPQYGVTASGKKTEEGVTIACPPHMEYNTKVYIPYLDNTYTCQDRGSMIKGDRIDVYFDSEKEALKFGKRALRAIVINK